MHLRLVAWLNRALGTSLFTYLVPNYVIMLALAAIAGTVWAARRAHSRGLRADAIYGMALWAFPAAILGARLASWVRAPWGDWVAFFDPLRGSMMAYGGFIGGVSAAWLHLRRYKSNVWRYLDCGAPAVGLGTAIARLGCFLDGDDFGRPTHAALSIYFPPGSPAFMEQLRAGLLAPNAPHSLPVHPVQLYLALNALLAAAAAAWWSARPRSLAGESFCLYWFLYACGRFALENLRGDAERGSVGLLSLPQAVSIVVAILAMGTVLRCRRFELA